MDGQGLVAEGVGGARWELVPTVEVRLLSEGPGTSDRRGRAMEEGKNKVSALVAIFYSFQLLDLTSI